MSDKIDEIVDRLIKGGRGSGRRGHKTVAPVSNITREFDPEKKKKILSSDRRAAKKEVKDHSPEELQSKIDSHKELSESAHLSPASRESYAAKHKVLVAHQKKQMKNKPAEAPAPEGIASRPGPFGNINKGGPGSGKKKGSGKIEPKHFEPNPNLRDKNKELDRLTPEQVKARNAERDRRMKENREARKKGEEPNYDRPSNTAHSDLDKSLETLFYMRQLAEEGRLKPKNKRNVKKSLGERLMKKQGVPKGVDPAKHERCVMDVKADGKDKSSAYAICNSSMNKAEEVLEKFLVGAAAKTGARVIQNLIKPAGSKGGEKADDVPGSPDGPSVAHGSGGAKQDKGPGKKMSKSLFEHLLEKGGIGSGRKGHHTFTDDGYEHESVFEDSEYDNVGEREAFKDKMIAAAERAEEATRQRIKEKESTAKRGISRKMHAPPEKKSLLSRIGQKIIDAI